MMQLSVVSTLYKSKPFLEEFICEILKAIENLQIVDFEMIFVNDGSPDDSLNYLIELKKTISQIKVIDLSRNFGHHYAIQAGLMYSSGELVFLIDNDLEVSPSVLISFYKELKQNNTLDVVYGYQEQRKGNFVEKQFGGLFWKLINMASEVQIAENLLTERLMTRQFVNELLRLQDANLFLGGMLHWVGFNQKGIIIKKIERNGQSTYSFGKRLNLVVQAITSFSGKPLEYLFYFGLLISVFSVLFIFYLVTKKIIHQDEVQLGWTSIIALNLLTLGIISTFIGMVGVYIFKIFRQVQGRPNFIIRKIY